MFILQVLFFTWLSLSLIKEMFSFNLISIKAKRSCEILLSVYFLFISIFVKQSSIFIVFCFFPPIFIFFLFIFLKKQEEKNLLLQVISLIPYLESGMKSGLSFLNAWQKAITEVKLKKIQDKMKDLTQFFQYQKEFRYPAEKKVELFIKDLILIHLSANPLKRLKYLRRKIKIELAFRVKSQRALLQVRIQSGILCFFYMSLLAWTILAPGQKYLSLIFISLFLFTIGLIWILKAGRKMKWSI